MYSCYNTGLNSDFMWSTITIWIHASLLAQRCKVLVAWQLQNVHLCCSPLGLHVAHHLCAQVIYKINKKFNLGDFWFKLFSPSSESNVIIIVQ